MGSGFPASVVDGAAIIVENLSRGASTKRPCTAGVRLKHNDNRRSQAADGAVGGHLKGQTRR